MAITQRTTRYPVLPRRNKAKERKQLQADVEKLYAEVMEGEAVLMLRLPGWQNADRLIESGLAGLVKLSQGENAEYALKACAMLIEFGNRQIERGGKALEGSAVMAQLEALYAKALPERSEPLLVNVEDEKETA